jgi:hypothetical protein
MTVGHHVIKLVHKGIDVALHVEARETIDEIGSLVVKHLSLTSTYSRCVAARCRQCTDPRPSGDQATLDGQTCCPPQPR